MALASLSLVAQMPPFPFHKTSSRLCPAAPPVWSCPDAQPIAPMDTWSFCTWGWRVSVGGKCVVQSSILKSVQTNWKNFRIKRRTLKSHSVKHNAWVGKRHYSITLFQKSQTKKMLFKAEDWIIHRIAYYLDVVNIWMESIKLFALLTGTGSESSVSHSELRSSLDASAYSVPDVGSGIPNRKLS